MNNTIDKSQWRSYFLATTGISIGIVTVYSFIVQTAGNRSVSSFTFPSRLPLSSWQLRERQSLKRSSSVEENTEIIEAAASYYYSQNDKKLQVDSHYIVGTRGDVANYIDKYTDIAPQALEGVKISRIKGIGYHYLFTSGDRAYLSSCISPRGQSNVTQKQFSQNRYRHDLRPHTWWRWLWGKASIRDRRCLWTHISIMVDETNIANIQTTYKTLETVWIDWYKWWQPQFPNL